VCNRRIARRIFEKSLGRSDPLRNVQTRRDNAHGMLSLIYSVR
jgi:hypothetical protein